MRICTACGRNDTETTVVLDHVDEFYAFDGSYNPARDMPICLDDYRAKTGRDYEGVVPE